MRQASLPARPADAAAEPDEQSLRVATVPAGERVGTVNHVFIDYENLQPAAVPALNHPDVRLVLLFGAKQRKVPLDLAVSIQPLGARVSYVEVDASAPEALDFHLIYLVGRTLAADPGAGIHIVSRDKGYDPLIRYLRNTGHRAFRVDSLKFLMRVDSVKALDLASRTELAWQMLNQYDGKPRTLERLHKTLKTLFHGALPEAEIADVVERLSAAGRYVRDGDEIRFAAA